MKGRRIFSIRFKIVLLIVVALTVSLCSYLYIGTTLIVGDKVSYIYDYNLSISRSAAQLFEGWIARVFSHLQTVAILPKESRQGKNWLENKLGIEQILFFKITASGFVAEDAAGGSAEDLLKVLGSTGWNEKFLQEAEYRITTNANQKLLLAMQVPSGETPVFVFAVAHSDSSLLHRAGSAGVSLFLYDSQARRLDSAQAKTDDGKGSFDLSERSMTEIIPTLIRSSFSSGVREWMSSSKEEYILSYEHIPGAELTVVAAVPKEAAFAASRALVQRSAALGVSILMLSVGLAMIFARGLTRRLRDLWVATRKVAEGDFSVRVKEQDGTSDEITSLGSSFNKMANKIDELIARTAEQARMEKELETAQVVQSRLFPKEAYSHENLNLSGKVVPASECGGDWWYYAPFGDRLLVVIGDVTGHGVSSALVTAAVHGGFTMLLQNHEREGTVPSMSRVIETLNSVVYSAAKEEATMTFVASLVDLNSGSMEFVNASHRPPYIYRNEKFKPLMDAKCPALGQDEKVVVESSTVDLEPGDVIFWYTDGVLECTNEEGKTISRNSLVKMVKQLNTTHSSDASAICDSFMQETMAFFGSNASNLADDVTVVFGAVPQQALFRRKLAA